MQPTFAFVAEKGAETVCRALEGSEIFVYGAGIFPNARVFAEGSEVDHPGAFGYIRKVYGEEHARIQREHVVWIEAEPLSEEDVHFIQSLTQKQPVRLSALPKRLRASDLAAYLIEHAAPGLHAPTATTHVLDLKKTPIYCLYVREDRKQHVESELQEAGLLAHFVKGYSQLTFHIETYKRNRICGATSYMKIIETHLNATDTYVPFLFLEDDVTIDRRIWSVWSRQGIVLPADTDILMLGTSRYGLLPDKNDARLENLFGYTTDIAVHRVYNMLSTHAVYCATRKSAMKLLMASLESAVRITCNAYSIADTIYVRCYHTLKAYAVQTPLFYQDARFGGEEEFTKHPTFPTQLLESSEEQKRFFHHLANSFTAWESAEWIQ